MALSAASATKRFLPSEDCARASGTDPAYFWLGIVVSSRRTILPVSVARTAPRSALARVTYRDFSSGLSRSAVGWEPGISGALGSSSDVQRVTFPVVRSNSATRERFHNVHQARRPSRVATTV